jgi:DNA-binding NtrC family response regulator
MVPQAKTKGILLVDSRGQLTAALKVPLEKRGYRVERLASSLEALRRVQCDDLDGVICDLADSSLSMAAFQVELENRCPDIAKRCIFVQSPEHEGEEEGPLVCQRPLDVDEAIEKITRVISLASAHH